MQCLPYRRSGTGRELQWFRDAGSARLRGSSRWVVVVLAGLAATPAPAASTVAKHSLTPNVQLTTTRIPKKLVEERVLRVTPSTTSVPDIVPASSAYPMFDLTSTMAAHAGALAAVNGDFGTTNDQPTHTLMIDGELWTTGDTRGNAIGWSEQGTTFVAGQPALRISVSTPKATRALRDRRLERACPAGRVRVGLYGSRRRGHDAARDVEPTRDRPVLLRGAARPDGGAALDDRPGGDRPSLHRGRAAGALPQDQAAGERNRGRGGRRIEGDVGRVERRQGPQRRADGEDLDAVQRMAGCDRRDGRRRHARGARRERRTAVHRGRSVHLRLQPEDRRRSHQGVLGHRSADVVQADPDDDRRSPEVQRMVGRRPVPVPGRPVDRGGSVDGGQPGRRRLHDDVGQEDRCRRTASRTRAWAGVS